MFIAVLLTTYNRKDKTLSCLCSLFNQQMPEGTRMEVYLTDDASSDGTAGAVSVSYPDVHISSGTGNLFWAGGMRKSWQMALKDNPDFYLLLNDDTDLAPNAISTLLSMATDRTPGMVPGISIGTTMDKETGIISYGGQKLYSKHSVKSYNVFSETEKVECDLGNANIMLVSKKVVDTIGILSDRYTHSIADFDYTLQAKKAGFKVVVAPGMLGFCKDDHGNKWKSQKSTLKERIAYLKSHKGLAYDEYMYFIRKHFPRHLPSAFTKLWMKTFFPFIWDAFKK